MDKTATKVFFSLGWMDGWMKRKDGPLIPNESTSKHCGKKDIVSYMKEQLRSAWWEKEMCCLSREHPPTLIQLLNVCRI